jgi:hypothetical protein
MTGDFFEIDHFFDGEIRTQAQQRFAVSETVQECAAPGARVSGKQNVVHSVANDKGFCGSGPEFL